MIPDTDKTKPETLNFIQKVARPERLFVLFGWLPWAMMALIFRLVQMFNQSGQTALFYLDTFRYAWGFYGLALCAGWFALKSLGKRLGAKAMVPVLGLVQVLLLILCFAEMASFNFWKVTGTHLDFSLIKYAASDISGVFNLVAESTPWYLYVLFILFVGLIVVLPLVILLKKNVPQTHTKAWGKSRVAVLAGLVLSMCLAFLPLLGATYAFSAVSPGPLYMLSSWWQGKHDADALANAVKVPQIVKSHDIKLKDGAKPKNIVFVILESTRAFSVNPYQDKYKTTPFLASLAKTSIVAQRAYAVVPHTSKALVSILCGVEPNLEMAIQEAKASGLPAECMARLLKKQGYDTAFFQTATKSFEWRTQLIDNMGYKDFYPSERLDKRGFEQSNYFGVEDAIMLKPSLKWTGKAKKPFFLTYLTLTPHHNYLAPKKRYGRKQYVKEDEFNRYLNSVHYVDQFSREVVEGLKAQGLYEDTIFVFVGDHGEGFNEHKRSQHDNVIYEEGIRVPLIIHDPSNPKAQSIKYNVSQLDIIPTVLRLAGWEIKPEQWRGQDMLTVQQEREMKSHCWYNRRCMALIKGDKKFIHHFGSQPDEFFDLEQDPLERKSTTYKDAGKSLAALKTWRQSILGTYKPYFEQTVKKYVKQTPPSNIQHTLDARFEDWFTLLGYNLSPATGPYRSGQKITVTTYYKVHKKVPAGWKLFVHGVNEKDKMVANMDHKPVEGLYPLSKWTPGQYVTDNHVMTIPERSKVKSRFKVKMGFWHKKKGRATIKNTKRVDGHKRLDLIDLSLK